MRIFAPKETGPGESRVPIVPASAGKLIKLGAEVEVESGIGASIHASDEDYSAVDPEDVGFDAQGTRVFYRRRGTEPGAITALWSAPANGSQPPVTVDRHDDGL